MQANMHVIANIVIATFQTLAAKVSYIRISI